MSVDQLNRVIVSSGHFASNAVRFADGLQRVVDLTTRVQVGSGTFNPNDRLFRLANAIDKLSLMPVHTSVGRRLLPMSQVNRFLDMNGIPRPMILTGENESSAWDRYMSQVPDHAKQGLKELALAYGSAASGDFEGALEHGLNASIECAQQIWDNFKSTWNGGVDRE